MASTEMWLCLMFCVVSTFWELCSGQSVAMGCHGEADVIFLVDTSASAWARDRSRSIDFIRNIVSGFEISAEKTRVGLAITQNPYTEIDLHDFSDKTLWLNEADHSAHHQDTDTNFVGALRHIRENMFSSTNGAREKNQDILFVISADILNIDDADLQTEMSRLKDNNVYVVMLLYGQSKTEQYKRDRAHTLVSMPHEQNLLIYRSSDAMTFQSITRNGQTLLCSQIPTCAGRADIVFVLDSSGSVNDYEWIQLTEFAAAVVRNMYIADDGVRVALIVYGNNANIIFNLTQYQTKSEIISAILSIPYQESYETNTHLALTVARMSALSTDAGNRIDVPDIAIVVTDGRSTLPGLTEAEAVRMHDANIRTFAIGIGERDVEFQQELNFIGSAPSSDHVFEVEEFTDLRFIEDTLVSRTCRPTPPVCEEEVDIIFIIDASGSISIANFERMINFVGQLVAKFSPQDIGPNNPPPNARVGILTYSNSPDPVMFLNDFEMAQDITNQLHDIVPERARTNTHLALEFAHSTMLAPERGNRPGVVDRLVVISDGESTNPDETQRVATVIKSEGIEIITLGVGEWTKKTELQNMASRPELRNSFHVPSYDTLFQAADIITSTACNVLNECESNPCINGQCVDGMNLYHCRCNTGWTGRNCDQNCASTADVIFALDSSGSIEEQNYYTMQEFVRDVISGLDVEGGARIGLVTFSSQARLEFDLDKYSTTQNVLTAINTRFMGGTTDTAEGIRLLREMFTTAQVDRPGKDSIAIILTDGKSDDFDRTMQEAVLARKAGIHIVSIGVGQSIRMAELQGMATDPDASNVYTVKDFNALTGIMLALLATVCNKENECDSNPCQNGGTCVNDIGMYTCRCTGSFSGLNCERACSTPIDMAFLIDNSGSIQRENFDEVVLFVKAVINQLDLDNGNVQVGVIKFNDVSDVVFYLDEFHTKEDVKLGMDKLRFEGGRTDTSAALKLMREQLFNNGHGDRDFVPNFAVIITDGIPNINRDSTVLEAINSRIDGTHLILITIGKGMRNGKSFIQLQSIPSEPVTENYFNVQRYSELADITQDVAASMCNDAQECDSNPCQNGGICMDGMKTYMCRCQSRYTGINCERECTRLRDIVFVVDISGSIELDAGFEIELKFLRQVIYGLNFNFGNTRVGYITFYRHATSRFYLNKYASDFALRDLQNAVTLDQIGHGTNISSGLEEALVKQFVSSNGDRVGVDNTVILLTDGHPTIETPEEVQRTADRLKSNNIEIYAIAIALSPNSGLLLNIAGSPGRYIEVRESLNVTDKANELLDKLC